MGCLCCDTCCWGTRLTVPDNADDEPELEPEVAPDADCGGDWARALEVVFGGVDVEAPVFGRIFDPLEALSEVPWTGADSVCCCAWLLPAALPEVILNWGE